MIGNVHRVTDPDAIKKSVEARMTASQTIGKIMYEEAAKKAGAAPGPEGAAPDAADATAEAPADEKKDDDVIDAEYEVKK